MLLRITNVTWIKCFCELTNFRKKSVAFCQISKNSRVFATLFVFFSSFKEKAGLYNEYLHFFFISFWGGGSAQESLMKKLQDSKILALIFVTSLSNLTIKGSEWNERFVSAISKCSQWQMLIKSYTKLSLSFIVSDSDISKTIPMLSNKNRFPTLNKMELFQLPIVSATNFFSDRETLRVEFPWEVQFPHQLPSNIPTLPRHRGFSFSI